MEAAAYIPSVDLLSGQCLSIVVDEQKVLAATVVLSQCPVRIYASFIQSEVRLIAAYRMFVSNSGGYESVWPIIAAGEPFAWIFAVHEAAELQKFADMGVNPFNKSQLEANLQQAHRHAILQESRFLKDWSKQLGYNISGLDIEKTNPVRRYLRNHHKILSALQADWGRDESAEGNDEQAEQFWEEIQKGVKR